MEVEKLLALDAAVWARPQQRGGVADRLNRGRTGSSPRAGPCAEGPEPGADSPTRWMGHDGTSVVKGGGDLAHPLLRVGWA